MEEVKFALARLPDVKVVEGNAVLTSSRQALSTLLDRHRRLHRVSARRPADPGLAAVLGDRAGTLPRSRSAAGDGSKTQPGDDDHSRRGGHHHRPGRSRRSRLRRRRAADVRPLARLLLRPARRPVLLAAAGGARRSARSWRSRSRRSSVSSAPSCRRGGCAAWRPTRSFRPRGADVTLSAQSLTKRYGAAPGYEAVRDASLELRVGEFVSIVGRSGSGKSTLMAMLGALTPADARPGSCSTAPTSGRSRKRSGRPSAPATSASSSSSRACCRT